MFKIGNTIKYFGIAALLLVLVYISLAFIPRQNGHLIGSDGVYYYSYLRSLVIDGDVDIANDVVLYNSRMDSANTLRVQESYEFSIGPALLWSPFYVSARMAVLMCNKMGLQIRTDGYSYLEEGAVCLGSIFYTFLGLALLYGILRKNGGARNTAIILLAVLCASPLLYYSLIEPFMSHALEFFTISLLLWLVLIREKWTAWHIFAIGLASGLVFLVRWQNAVFLTLIPCSIWFKEDVSLKIFIRQLGVWGAGMVPVMACQAFCWWLTLGSPFLIPQGDGFLTVYSPHFFQVLFSFRHGLFIWHPVFLAGTIGLFFMRDRRLGLLLFGIFLLDIAVCGMVRDWWAGHSFGMRRMVGSLPLIALGLGAMIHHFNSRARRNIILLIVLMIMWNGLSMLQYKLRLIPADRCPTFTEMTAGRLLVPVRAWQLLQGESVKRYSRGI